MKKTSLVQALREVLEGAKRRYRVLVQDAGVLEDKLRLERSFVGQLERERDAALATRLSAQQRTNRAVEHKRAGHELHQNTISLLQVSLQVHYFTLTYK